MANEKSAVLKPDDAGELKLYVATETGEVQLSPDQAAFVAAAFADVGQVLEPAESVTLRSDSDRVGAILGWPEERLLRVALELETLGIVTVNPFADTAEPE